MDGWQQLVGHTWATSLLRAALHHDRVGHAYLITGPAQIGKTLLATILAQALNCTAPMAQRPCLSCRPCTLIGAGKFPDVRLLEPEISARGRATIKIDAIRTLQQNLMLTATEGRCKVAIITQFDAATTGAANAFLKTLEEPPRNVVLLLTATEGDPLIDQYQLTHRQVVTQVGVLPTIKSRCQSLLLRPPTATEIATALQSRWSVAPEQAQLLAHLADGRMGWAVQAVSDPKLLAARRRQLDLLYDLLGQNRVGRFAHSEKMGRKPEQLPALLQAWLSWWRDLVLLSWGNSEVESLVNIDEAVQLQSFHGRWSPAQILSSLQQTEAALWQIANNANTRLVLENLLLVYPVLN